LVRASFLSHVVSPCGCTSVLAPMIYLFNGITAICGLPGMMCQACGDACRSLPGCCGLCSAIGRCFDKLGTECYRCVEMPLTGYVIFSLLLSSFAVWRADQDFHHSPGCHSMYLLAIKAFSLINVVFAIYMACVVRGMIMEEVNKRPTSGQGCKVRVPVQEVQHAFREVFMKNLVVLFMFFALLGMFLLTWMGPDSVDFGRMCRISEPTKWCGYAFFCVAFLYSFAYLKCSCCASSVTVTKSLAPREEMSHAHAAQAFQSVPQDTRPYGR